MDVIINKDVHVFFFVVPFEIESTVVGAIPVNSTLVV